MKRAVIFNLGCKVNQYECDVLAQELAARGYGVSEELGYADLYIVNTCAVTAEAERKSRQVIARCRKHNPSARIMITGCASEKNKDFYIKSGVQYVSGVADKKAILTHLDGELAVNDARPAAFEEPDCVPAVSRTRAYVKIQDGCDNFCSYCIIPYLRGRSRSRDLSACVREIGALAGKTGEIVLTGINLSKFGVDTGTSLAELIEKIADVPVRIRLGSFYVEGVDERLLNALKGLKEFCPHFHLSLQNGDDGVLKDMGRKYTSREYLDKVALIRRYFPSAAITTDVIVGYPTETEEAFRNTLAFVREAAFADLHIFPFSAREGTRAALLAPLDPSVIARRKNELAKERDVLRTAYIDSMTGIPQKALFEEVRDGYAVGYSEYYLRIYTPCDVHVVGKCAIIIPTEKFHDGLKGEIYGK